MKKCILIIEDDNSIRRFLATSMGFEGFCSLQASCAQEGLDALHNNDVDLILLDLGLPDMNGLVFLRRLRKNSQIPVIVVSAIHDGVDKVKALDAGADDYVTKPFDIKELVARIHANLRRAPSIETNVKILEFAEMSMNLEEQIVTIDNNIIKLTRKEFKLLQIFMENSGKVLNHATLLKAVWGVGYQHETHYLRVFINQLRHKIEKDPTHPRWIVTQMGVGYRFGVE
jgi:two-component system KDP operon response regulator KdpE